MIPPAFDYIAPKTLAEAVAALGQNADSKIGAMTRQSSVEHSKLVSEKYSL